MRNRLATRIIRIILVIFLVGAVAGYSYSKSQDYINGPQVTVTSPTDGETVTSQLLTVAGVTHNITEISLNGRKIFINEENEFAQSVLLSPGYNVITVWAKDRFEKITETHIRVVYNDADENQIDTIIN